MMRSGGGMGMSYELFFWIFFGFFLVLEIPHTAFNQDGRILISRT